MNITTVGVDLAKLVFQIHGVDARGKVAMRKQLKRSQVIGFFTQLPPCLVGMEACGGAHYWARKLTQLGHTVKLKGFVTERTAQANQIRGLLSEFGLVMPVGIRCIGSKLPEILDTVAYWHVMARHGSSAAPRYCEIGRRFDLSDMTYSAERFGASR
jgi:transposase